MCARTACLSVLTHLSPTFWPRMGRSDRVCPFASARWGVFSPFFCSHGRVWTRGGRLHWPSGASPAGRPKRPPAVRNGPRTNKWVKVLPTSRPKWTAEARPTYFRPICGREMRLGGHRPWWLAIRAYPCLARKSVNQKILATAALHKKLPVTIFLQTTATLLYPYTSSPRRRPRPAVAYKRLSPQPRSTVLEP
jgi:hypothetical protein